MSKETVFATPAEKAIYDRATASDYIKFGNGEVDVQFVNGKVTAVAGIGGKESYEYDVILTTDEGKEAKILGTQAKGLMIQFLTFYPLTGKRFLIRRTGEGFQTVYDVEEL